MSYTSREKVEIHVSQPRGVELGHLWAYQSRNSKKKKKKCGKGAEGSYLVRMLKGIILSP